MCIYFVGYEDETLRITSELVNRLTMLNLNMLNNIRKMPGFLTMSLVHFIGLFLLRYVLV